MNDFPAIGYLILLSDTQGSVRMIDAVIPRMSNLQHAEVTLIHYLEPLLWHPETVPQADELAALFENENLLPSGHSPGQRYFQASAQRLLQAGVSGDKLHIEPDWRDDKVITRRIEYLGRGTYSVVVIVSHHLAILYRLLGVPLQQILEQHKHPVSLWVLDG